jgi:hypothetical protein
MKTLALVASLIAACPVSAEPNQPSQHPRVGELAKIDFIAGSARLSVDYNRKLGEIVGWAQTYPDGMLVINGFAAPGEKVKEGDVVLSLHRAEVVRDGLIDQGIDPDRIVIAAFGARGAARAVVWGTREGRDTAVSRLQRAHPTAIIWGSQPRTAVAGR